MWRCSSLILAIVEHVQPLKPVWQVHLSVDPGGDAKKLMRSEVDESGLELCSGVQICNRCLPQFHPEDLEVDRGFFRKVVCESSESLPIAPGADAIDCSAANNGDCPAKYCCTRGKACYQCGGDGYDCSNAMLGLHHCGRLLSLLSIL